MTAAEAATEAQEEVSRCHRVVSNKTHPDVGGAPKHDCEVDCSRWEHWFADHNQYWNTEGITRRLNELGQLFKSKEASEIVV